MKVVRLLGALALAAGVLLIAACTKSTTGGEAAIEKMNVQWLDLVAKKDAAKIAETIYAEDGVMLPPNAPRLNGREAIQGIWSQLLGIPGAELSFKTDRVVMSTSGDMAADIGNYDLKTGEGASQTTEHGKYVVVWVKRGGAWHVLSDMFSSDSPPAEPAH
jgi:uncharacterized protein (TIGR02246 family)